MTVCKERSVLRCILLDRFMELFRIQVHSSFICFRTVLELRDISFTIQKDGHDVPLIQEVTFKVSEGHFMAIVGPSGCGKTTLLKLVAGINVESGGQVCWAGRDLSTEGDLEPAEIGYVPQFSVAYENLTVEENVEAAIRLRARTENRDAFHDLTDRTLSSVGLGELRERPVRVLSGGQKRRLSLALELVSSPVLLLCDEVTSGLDPKSEEEIVRLLHDLSREGGRVVIIVTHSLAHLELYDSVLVMHQGRAVYHGPPRALEHYFGVKEVEDVYPQLTKRPGEDWQRSWEKHREDYNHALLAAGKAARQHKGGEPGASGTSAETPGFFAQFFALFFRRCRIFVRDSGNITLHAAILLGFPFLVVIFAMKGVGVTRELSDILPQTMADFERDRQVMSDNLGLGRLVSGLVMFQVILLTLMGSNNSSREIAGERHIYEKEKLGGVRASSYLASKLAFLGILVTVQSTWMALFVQGICGIPTVTFWPQLALLLLVNAAMTAICLGISGLAKTADQASLLGVYLVGFQLPLSGALLALPPVLDWLTRPFISAYWSWSGIMRSLEKPFYNAVDQVTDTAFMPASAGYVVLGMHVVLGLFLAYIGVKKPRWE